MDNAGGSQVLAGVADRVRDFLLTTPRPARRQLRAVAGRRPQGRRGARPRSPRMIGAARPEEVVLGGSTTFLLAAARPRHGEPFAPGDEIVVTDVDHEFNIGPWRGAGAPAWCVRDWQVDPDSFELDLAALERLLGPRTRLVCVTHCSNMLGTINADRRDRPPASTPRAPSSASTASPSAAPRASTSQASGCDWYVYSFYKTYGPHQAVLWGRHERLLELDSLNHWFIGKDRVPYKLAARQRELRAGLGLRRHPGLSGRAGRRHHARPTPSSVDRGARGSAGRAAAGLAARPQRRAHHRPPQRRPRGARADDQLRRRRAGDPSDIVGRVDRAPGRHPLRRLLLPPPGRALGPRRAATASSASRWSTTTRWTRSTG